MPCRVHIESGLKQGGFLLLRTLSIHSPIGRRIDDNLPLNIHLKLSRKRITRDRLCAAGPGVFLLNFRNIISYDR